VPRFGFQFFFAFFAIFAVKAFRACFITPNLKAFNRKRTQSSQGNFSRVPHFNS